MRKFPICLVSSLAAIGLSAQDTVVLENAQIRAVFDCRDPRHRTISSAATGCSAANSTKMTRRYSPEFIMTGEGPYDIQGQYYATYTRAAVDHTPLMRYIDSELPIICAVTDHLDRNRVNMCLMNRYIVSYEPRNFKGRLGEFPRIMEYGGKVDALRRRYKDRLWDVVFNSTQGAIVVIER